MLTSLTPSGVEHSKKQDSSTRLDAMLTSLTPSGVEHNRLRSIMLGLSNAHLSDALRR